MLARAQKYVHRWVDGNARTSIFRASIKVSLGWRYQSAQRIRPGLVALLQNVSNGDWISRDLNLLGSTRDQQRNYRTHANWNWSGSFGHVRISIRQWYSSRLICTAQHATPRHATLRCAIAIATRYTAEERTAIYCNKCSGGAGLPLKKKKKIQGAIDPRLKIMAIIRADRYTMPYCGVLRCRTRLWLRVIENAALIVIGVQVHRPDRRLISHLLWHGTLSSFATG